MAIFIIFCILAVLTTTYITVQFIKLKKNSIKSNFKKSFSSTENTTPIIYAETTIQPTTTYQLPDPNKPVIIDYSQNFYSKQIYSIADNFYSGTTSDNFKYVYNNNINGISIIGYNLNSSSDYVYITIPQNIKVGDNIYPVKAIGVGNSNTNFFTYGSQGYLSSQSINVIVQEPVEYINSYAFMGTNIVTLILPRTLKKIYDNSLSGNRLLYIVIPPNVSEIGNFAFAESSISKFYFVGPVPKIIGIDCFAVSILNPVVVFSPQNVPAGLIDGSIWNGLKVEINPLLQYYPPNYPNTTTPNITKIPILLNNNLWKGNLDKSINPQGNNGNVKIQNNSLYFSYFSRTLGFVATIQSSLINLPVSSKYTVNFDIQAQYDGYFKIDIDFYDINNIVFENLNFGSTTILLNSLDKNVKYNNKKTITLKTTKNMLLAKYCEFTIMGKDKLYWKGFFGPIISNILLIPG